MESTIEYIAVDKITIDQKIKLDLKSVLWLNARTDKSIQTSKSGANVTRNLYAVINCFKGWFFHIFVATIGTVIPRGKIIVGANRAVVCYEW